MIIDEGLDRLAEVIDKLSLSLNQLMEVLKNEREAVVMYDWQQVQKIGQVKNQQVHDIKLLEKQKDDVFLGLRRKYGLVDYTSIFEFIKQIKASHSQQKVWKDKLSKIRSLSQAIAEMNESERVLIQHSLKEIENRIRLIDSQNLTTTFQSQVYNKKGVFSGETTQKTNSRVTRSY